MNRFSERKRLPQLARAAADGRPPLRLTLRDISLVEGVWQYRALSTAQLAALYFEGAEALRVCQRRLQRLYHHGYLARLEQPSGRSEGSRPFLYLLDKAGAMLLLTEVGMDPEEFDWTPWDNAVGAPYLEHLLATNDVRIAMTLAARRRGWVIDPWLDDKTLRSRQAKDYVTIRSQEGRSQKAAIVPDGYFKLATADDAYNFFLEIDKRTVTGESGVWGRRDWARKIRVYVAYYGSGGYEKRYDTLDMRVLTVTTGSKRLANLREITEKVAGAQADQFWFTTFDELTPGAVLTEPIWTVGGLARARSLLPPSG